MGNEDPLLFWRIMQFGVGPIAGAIVAGLIIVFSHLKIEKIKSTQASEKEKAEAIRSQERDEKLATWIIDSIGQKAKPKAKSKTEKPVKTKKMKEKEKSGDTYNVTSNNQSGGITVGKIEINVKDQEQADELNIPINDNFSVVYDKVTMRFECHPRVGKWEKPFIAVPFNEKDSFKKFGGKESMLTDFQDGLDFSIDGTKFYGSSCGVVSNNAKPATSKFFYYMEASSVPSYIIFGDYQKIAYKFNPSDGTCTTY